MDLDILEVCGGAELASDFNKWKKTSSLFEMAALNTQLAYTCSKWG